MYNFDHTVLNFISISVFSDNVKAFVDLRE